MRSCTLIAIAVLAAGGTATGDAPQEEPLLDRLAAEARGIQAKDPGAWKRYDIYVHRALQAHARRYAYWMARPAPPGPSIVRLKLPISYLAECCLREDPVGGHHLHADAIARSDDARRLEILVELWRHSSHHAWGLRDVLVEHLTAPLAAGVIEDAIASGRRLDRSHIGFLLLEKHADRLPTELRRRGVAWLRKEYPYGPANGAGERYWKTILRLGGREERDALAKHFRGGPRGCLYPTVVFLSAPGASQPVAAALRRQLRWSSPKRDRGFRTYVWRALLHADPDSLEDWLRHLRDVREETGHVKGYDGPHWELLCLVNELKSCDREPARKELRSLLDEPALSMGFRADLLLALVRMRDPQAPALVETWLPKAPESLREHTQRQLRELEVARE